MINIFVSLGQCFNFVLSVTQSPIASSRCLLSCSKHEENECLISMNVALTTLVSLRLIFVLFWIIWTLNRNGYTLRRLLVEAISTVHSRWKQVYQWINEKVTCVIVLDKTMSSKRIFSIIYYALKVRISSKVKHLLEHLKNQWIT